MSMLSDMGITVVESEDPEEAPAAQDGEDAAEEEEPSRAVRSPPPSVPAVTQTRAEPTERTDDPVRMYLRDMGSVELLSREGEIAIAKRIEAGREAMIAGLCESPLTFQAVIIWRDELKDAKILLRDIIDLEATYEGPEAKAAPPPMPVAPPPVEAPPPPPAAAAGDGAARRRRRAAPRGRDGGRRGLRERALARRHGGRAQAQGARDLRQHRRHLQEAAQAAGQEGRDAGCERAVHAPAAEGLRQAARRDHRLRQEPLAQQRPHREPGRAALLHQQAPGGAGEPADAAGRQLRRAAPDTSSTSTSATSSTRPGSSAWRNAGNRKWGQFIKHETRSDRHRSATRSARWPPRRASRSPSSAASSRPCRRASARPARPRRRWWRPTCASSSPSPRSTPTAACSSWT